MIPAERQRFILSALERRNVASIADLAEEMAVSHMTVRRDIQSLRQAGRVIPVSGGVRLAERLAVEPDRSAKSLMAADQKRAIAAVAASLVQAGEVVYLDAGTTCLAIAAELATKTNLTVVTNDLAVAAYLMHQSGCELLLTGGRVLRDNESCAGLGAARFLDDLNIDLAFLSASSWDLAHISTPDESKVPVKRAAAAASAKRVLVSDASKFGRVAMFNVLAMSDLDLVITDDTLDDEVVTALSGAGIQVRIADAENLSDRK